MSRAFSTGHHPLGTDLRMAAIADADDVAQLLSELGYPCDIDEAAERIAAITDNDRQALVVARRDGAVADRACVNLFVIQAEMFRQLRRCH